LLCTLGPGGTCRHHTNPKLAGGQSGWRYDLLPLSLQPPLLRALSLGHSETPTFICRLFSCDQDVCSCHHTRPAASLSSALPFRHSETPTFICMLFVCDQDECRWCGVVLILCSVLLVLLLPAGCCAKSKLIAKANLTSAAHLLGGTPTALFLRLNKEVVGDDYLLP